MSDGVDMKNKAGSGSKRVESLKAKMAEDEEKERPEDNGGVLLRGNQEGGGRLNNHRGRSRGQ